MTFLVESGLVAELKQGMGLQVMDWSQHAEWVCTGSCNIQMKMKGVYSLERPRYTDRIAFARQPPHSSLALIGRDAVDPSPGTAQCFESLRCLSPHFLILSMSGT